MKKRIAYRFLVNTDPENFEVRDLENVGWRQFRIYRKQLVGKGNYIPLYDLAALNRWAQANSQFVSQVAQLNMN